MSRYPWPLLLSCSAARPFFLFESRRSDLIDMKPLHQAIVENRLSAVKSLLDSVPEWQVHLLLDASLNGDGFTALHLAASLGYKEIISCLIKKLPYHHCYRVMKKQNIFGKTFLHYLGVNGNVEILKQVLEFVSLDDAYLLIATPDSEGNTLLHDAATAGQINLLEFIQNWGEKYDYICGNNTSHALFETRNLFGKTTVGIMASQYDTGTQTNIFQVFRKLWQNSTDVSSTKSSETSDGRKGVAGAEGDDYSTEKPRTNTSTDHSPRTYDDTCLKVSPPDRGDNARENSDNPEKADKAQKDHAEDHDNDDELTQGDQEQDYFASNGIDWIFSPLKHGIQSAVQTIPREILCYPVALYPDNQNPLVPLSLQKKLDAMSLKEFCHTVLHDLTQAELEALMADERYRRRTFLTSWQYDNNLSHVNMAKAGFYLKGDSVQCAFCQLVIHNWEWKDSDEPMREHQSRSQNCRFVRGEVCGNRECENDVFTADAPNNITFLCRPEMLRLCRTFNHEERRLINAAIAQNGKAYEDANIKEFLPTIHRLEEKEEQQQVKAEGEVKRASPASCCISPEECVAKESEAKFPEPVSSSEAMKRMGNDGVSGDFSALGNSTVKPEINLYADAVKRRNTYAVWPASAVIASERLSEAGFYYTGHDDKVKCFYCGGGLQEWHIGDDPWEEHARWFPHCSFLLQRKGKAYVKQVQERTEEGKTSCQTTKQKITDAKRNTKTSQQNVAFGPLCDEWEESCYVGENDQSVAGAEGDNYSTEKPRTNTSTEVVEKDEGQYHYPAIPTGDNEAADENPDADDNAEVDDNADADQNADTDNNADAVDNADATTNTVDAAETDYVDVCHETVAVYLEDYATVYTTSHVPILHTIECDTTETYTHEEPPMDGEECDSTNCEAEMRDNMAAHAAYFVDNVDSGLIIYSVRTLYLTIGRRLQEPYSFKEKRARTANQSSPGLAPLLEMEDVIKSLKRMAHHKNGRTFSDKENSKKGLPNNLFTGDREQKRKNLSNRSQEDWDRLYTNLIPDPIKLQRDSLSALDKPGETGRSKKRQKGSYHRTSEVDWIFSPLQHGIQSAVGTVQKEILCYPVARYPDNQNPLLPLSLQKKLGAMSPREFLTTVLHDLSLEERESLMVDEKQRRTTFLVNWPHENNLSGIKMAQAGFYCVDDNDRVQCVFCRGSLQKWEEQDNPMTEHAKMFPFCRFAKGLECGNKEYRSDVLTTDELKNILFLCVPDMKKNRDGSVSTNSNALGISTNKAAIIKYAIADARRNTYSRWPASNALEADILCEAGFYYTGFDDQVRCFFCAGGLRDWASGDDPWEEHARWFPDCSFLIQHKSEAYVNEVHKRTAEGKKCSRQTVLQKKAEKEYKQRVSQQKAMYNICLELQHERRVIDIAINRNGKAFDSIRDLIETAYKIEEEEDMGMETERSSQKMVFMSATSAPIKAQEDVSRLLQGDEEMMGIIQTDAVEAKHDPGTCVTCFRKSLRSIDATQVALPCGHMIYCDKCAKDEKERVDTNQSYKSRCPAQGCSSLMTGLFRTYVN